MKEKGKNMKLTLKTNYVACKLSQIDLFTCFMLEEL